MTKRFISKCPVLTGPDIILERPEIGLRIARLVGSWRSVEEGLELVYSSALRALIAKNRQSHGVTDVVARQVLDTLYQIKPKLTVVKAALGSLDDQIFHGRLVKLEPKIGKLASDRNRLIHCTWGICDAHPSDLIIFGREGTQVYGAADFDDLIGRMQAMQKSLLAFVADIPEAKASR